MKSKPFKKTVISCIEFYQKHLSFDTGLLKIFAPYGVCRYNPTCSEYTKQAIIKHGILKGGYMGIVRIISCNPFTKYGTNRRSI